MSSTADLEKMLRKAIEQAKQAAPQASDDLYRFSSAVAEVVDRVSDGVLALELVVINQPDGADPAFQLQLRKVGSEAPPSDLGVYTTSAQSAAGYPVRRWYSRSKWESQPDDPSGNYETPPALEGHFQWMISKPESRLVLLVMFFQQQKAQSGGNSLPPTHAKPGEHKPAVPKPPKKMK